MINASYVSDDMHNLDEAAKANGVLLMNEIGLDPGIDHLIAMKTKHALEAKGSKIIEFHSYCGGIPSPKANNNPLQYKFSWSPLAALRAGRSHAHYIDNDEEVHIAAGEVLATAHKVDISPEFQLEMYPNRDSLAYKKTYGFDAIQTLIRGHSALSRYIDDYGLL